MQTPPLITVIIPIHNAAKYLIRAVENLKQLESPTVEFVVVNDHSTDGSAESVRDWPQLMSNVTVIDSGGLGVAAARNEAVAISRGEFLWFTDCDDDWDPAILTRMLAAATTESADIVLCNARKLVSGSGEESLITDAPDATTLSGSVALGKLLNGDVQGHLWNKLFRRSLFEGITFPATRAHSDLGAMFELLASADTVVLLPETLYTYYIHSGSILNQKAYRWDDLWDCLTIAQSSVETAPQSADLRNDLVTFKYRNVIIPITNESVRRDSWEPAETIRAVRARARRHVRLGEIMTLARMGQPDAAVRAMLILALPPLYLAVYRRHRRRAMMSVDGG